MPLMLTPRPIDPDCQRTRSIGSMAWFGNFAISRNQPESSARIVPTVSHSDAKNSGKRTAILFDQADQLEDTVS
jgi:hypothetical protein